MWRRLLRIGVFGIVTLWNLPLPGQGNPQDVDNPIEPVTQADMSGSFPPVESGLLGVESQVSPPVAQQAASSSYEAGDGLTVSMLNGTSKLKLFGQISALATASTDRMFAPGLPFFVLPSSPFGLNTNTFDLGARQSAFGAIFSGPEVCGLTPGATVLVFLANDSMVSDTYGLLPYQAFGELKNDDWRFAAGLQSDVFNPVNPTTVSLGKMYSSGNTGSFRGQIRGERNWLVGDDRSLKTQFAISEPLESVFSNRDLRILEDNGWPNLESRAAIGLGAIEELCGGRKQRFAELGLSGVVGQIRTSRSILAPSDPQSPNREVIDVWGVGSDVQIAATPSAGFSGEFFVGQGLGEYNGGITQSFNSVTLQPIRASGGFGEGYYYLSDTLHVHTGYGIDAPNTNDLAATQIVRNQTYFTNVVWNLSKTVQISFEVDYRKTNYTAPLLDADGVVFQTEFLWKF